MRGRVVPEVVSSGRRDCGECPLFLYIAITFVSSLFCFAHIWPFFGKEPPEFSAYRPRALTSWVLSPRQCICEFSPKRLSKTEQTAGLGTGDDGEVSHGHLQ